MWHGESIDRGHPLALGMATSIVLSEAGRTIEEAGLHQVIEALSRSYIEAVPDPITRRALEASSVVRCVRAASTRSCRRRRHATPWNGSPRCHSSSLVVRACSFMMRCAAPLPAVLRRGIGFPSRVSSGGVGVPSEQAAARAFEDRTVALHRRPPLSDPESRASGRVLSERSTPARRRARYTGR